MAKQLESASVAAPGFFGLNTQESSVTLAAGFALQADNCIIDQYGRLGSRKGWTYVTTSGGTSSALVGGHEFRDIDGDATVVSWSNTTFYKGTSTLAAATDNSTSFTVGNFDSATLNDKAFFFQRGQEPRYYDPVGDTVEDLTTAGNTVAPPLANTGVSAYGRLWIADTSTSKTTVYWSDLLDGTDFDSGSAGSIDISSILVQGNDEIVALGAHTGRLFVFCKNNIIIFGDTDGDKVLNPVNMQLVEVIKGVGCVARDSLQNTGNDIIFLSETGIVSLGRLIQEKSQPMRDISKNVRDDIISILTQSSPSEVRSLYNPTEAVYLLLFPTFSQAYCVDMRGPLEDGSSRITTWNNQTHTNMLTVDNKIYFTQTDGLAQYDGYSDNTSPYVMRYFTNYFDFGDSTRTKILKRINTTVIGGSNQAFVLKAGYDYSDSYLSYPAVLDNLTNYEYGVAEYNIAEYSIGTLVDQVRASMGGDGNVIQVGVESTINGAPLSIQRLDIYVKQGRIL